MLFKVQSEWRDVKLQGASVVYVEEPPSPPPDESAKQEFDNECPTSREPSTDRQQRRSAGGLRSAMLTLSA